MKRILDYFYTIEHPTDEQMMDGLEEDVLFSSISTTYLNGFINYCKIKKAYMVNSYMFEKDWERACARVDLLPVQFHTDISDASKFDDVIILAENKNWWFFFDNDCDCNYCGIGKLSKKKYEAELILEAFKNEAEARSKDGAHLKKIKEMGPEHFKGWIML